MSRVKQLIGEDGGDMLQILNDMARGKLQAKAHSLVTGDTYEVGPSFQDRMRAATELLNRGFGKPTDTLELTGKDGGPLRAVFRIEEG